MFEEKIINNMGPSKWWHVMKIKQKDKHDANVQEGILPKGFCEFIQCFLCCPSSSGFIERVFSSFGLVWTKVRNSLGIEKTHKLVSIYRHYAALKKAKGESDW